MSDDETPDRAPSENPTMTLARASWSITALVLAVGGLILLIRGDIGYAIVTLVIAIAAAINLL